MVERYDFRHEAGLGQPPEPIGSREQAETIRPMAFNQGFYNLAHAVGLFVGIVMLGRDGAAGVVGKTLVIFAPAFLVVAGVVRASTGKK